MLLSVLRVQYIVYGAAQALYVKSVLCGFLFWFFSYSCTAVVAITTRAL